MFGFFKKNVMPGTASRSFFPSLYSIIAVGYLASLGWSHVGFERPQIPDALARWVDGAVPKIVEDIDKNKDNINTIAVAPFSGDPSGYVYEAVRVEASKKNYIVDKKILEKLYDLLNLSLDSKPEPLTPERQSQLGKYAAQASAQAVIWGSVNKTRINESNQVEAEIEYYLIDKSGKVLYKNVCNNEALKKADVAAVTETTVDKFHNIDWRTRVLLWALGVITFPLITINFLISTTAKRSNKANAFALIVYTLIDGIALYLINPPNFKEMEFYSVLFFICMILLAGVCNLVIMDFARKLKE